MDKFFANFVHKFKYEIRTNSCEFIRIRTNFLHEKLVMLRMACTVGERLISHRSVKSWDLGVWGEKEFGISSSC